VQTTKARGNYNGRFRAPDFTSNMTKEEAFVTVLAAAVHADNRVRRVEDQELMALLGRTRTLHSTTAEERRRLLDDAVDAVRDRKRINHVLENACAKLCELEATADHAGICASVFAHACDIVYADLEFHRDEAELLAKLKKKLALDVEQAHLIQKHIVLKNKH